MNIQEVSNKMIELGGVLNHTEQIDEYAACCIRHADQLADSLKSSQVEFTREDIYFTFKSLDSEIDTPWIESINPHNIRSVEGNLCYEVILSSPLSRSQKNEIEERIRHGMFGSDTPTWICFEYRSPIKIWVWRSIT